MGPCRRRPTTPATRHGNLSRPIPFPTVPPLPYLIWPPTLPLTSRLWKRNYFNCYAKFPWEQNAREIFAQLLSAPRGYHWQIPEHEAIFQALARIPQLSGTALRTMLPAQLTRAGFPDIDIASYFAPLDVAEDERTERAGQIAAALIANPILK